MNHNIRHHLNIINEAMNPKVVTHLTDDQQFLLGKFIYRWLSGEFMTRNAITPEVVATWKTISKLFPPKLSGTVPLYRLVTLPIEYASKKEFTFSPAVGPISSWSQKMTGIDAVMGVARDIVGDDRQAETCRVAVQADIPGEDILATPLTIRDAFMSLTHDYFGRFPEVVTRTQKDDGYTYVNTTYDGWPDDDHTYTRDDVGFLQDVLNRRGGHYKQYECIVVSPGQVHAKVVKVYRIGNKVLDSGNDDPHGG